MAFPSVRLRLIVVKHAVGNVIRAEKVPSLTPKCNIAAQSVQCLPIFISSLYKVQRGVQEEFLPVKMSCRSFFLDKSSNGFQ
jgi:hypothetical protein